MWVGIEGKVGIQAGKIDDKVVAPRAKNGLMVGSSERRREVVVDLYSELETSNASKRFDTRFGIKNNASAEATMKASKQEDNDSKESPK